VQCPLCHSKQLNTKEIIKSAFYLSCERCSLVFMHPDSHIATEAEKRRYQEHNNDVEDLRYQKFVSPIVDAVKAYYDNKNKGLDFGAGTGPVITKMLEDQGYQMTLWDPFFHPDVAALDAQYDFIVCCEVIEHFRKPDLEFKRLHELLKPGGRLFCKTDLLPETPFKDWYYVTDPTHIIFYSEEALRWIQANFGFSEVQIEDRLITFRKRRLGEINALASLIDLV
jgi:2-polyprenyl-3-methyl-5-hydroxy-6-metoxy-1,4-benzoquinol methylase